MAAVAPASNTPNGIITDAMVDAGLIQLGDSPSSEQLAANMRRLVDVINFEQTQGLKLWVNVDTAVTLTAGQATYTFTPSGDVDMTKPLRVLQGYYLYTSTNVRRPLTVLSWNDYLTLGQAGTLSANRGAINSYFVDKQATTLSVTFWLCPDSTEASNGTAHVLLQTKITNPTNLTETMSFPDEWRMFLRWALADDIATGQPQAIMDRCAGKAAAYRAALEDWDVEDAPTRFTPDNRSQYATGGFR